MDQCHKYRKWKEKYIFCYFNEFYRWHFLNLFPGFGWGVGGGWGGNGLGGFHLPCKSFWGAACCIPWHSQYRPGVCPVGKIGPVCIPTTSKVGGSTPKLLDELCCLKQRNIASYQLPLNTTYVITFAYLNSSECNQNWCDSVMYDNR